MEERDPHRTKEGDPPHTLQGEGGGHALAEISEPECRKKHGDGSSQPRQGAVSNIDMRKRVGAQKKEKTRPSPRRKRRPDARSSHEGCRERTTPPGKRAPEGRIRGKKKPLLERVKGDAAGDQR